MKDVRTDEQIGSSERADSKIVRAFLDPGNVIFFSSPRFQNFLQCSGLVFELLLLLLLFFKENQFSSVQSLSHVRLFATSWTAARQASLSITKSWSLLKLMSIELVTAIQPSHPLSSRSPPSFNRSQHQGLFK